MSNTSTDDTNKYSYGIPARNARGEQIRTSMLNTTSNNIIQHQPVNIQNVSRYNVIQAVAALEKTCDYLEFSVTNIHKQLSEIKNISGGSSVGGGTVPSDINNKLQQMETQISDIVKSTNTLTTQYNNMVNNVSRNLSEFDTALTKLSSKLDDQTSNITVNLNNLKKQVTSQATDVNTLQTTTNELAIDVNDLKSTTTGLTTDVNNLKSTTTGLTTDVNTLQTTTTGLTTDVNELKSTTDNLTTTIPTRYRTKTDLTYADVKKYTPLNYSRVDNTIEIDGLYDTIRIVGYHMLLNGEFDITLKECKTVNQQQITSNITATVTTTSDKQTIEFIHNDSNSLYIGTIHGIYTVNITSVVKHIALQEDMYSCLTNTYRAKDDLVYENGTEQVIKELKFEYNGHSSGSSSSSVYIINNDIELDNLHVVCTTHLGDKLDVEYNDCINKFKNTTSIGTRQTVKGNEYDIELRFIEQFAYELDFKYITSSGSGQSINIDGVKLTTTIIEHVVKHIALQEDINSSGVGNASISDNYEVPDDMIMLQSNENKNILIPCSETEYVDISSLSDSLETLFNVDTVYGYESDAVGKLKIKKCRKVAIITSVNVNKFIHKHVEYDISSKSLTVLAYNDNHYPTGIQHIIFNVSLVTFNTINFATDVTNCIFDKSFEFYMNDTSKLNVIDSNVCSLSCAGIDVSRMTKMNNMFFDCTLLTSLDLSNWDTSNVTDISYMFSRCKSLTSLNISNWDISNVTNIECMFYECVLLTSLDISNWNTSNVTSMKYLFNECRSLISLNLPNWNPSNVTDMGCVFYGCKSLILLNISNWDISNVTSMSSMFYGCKSLTSLDISNWNTSNVTSMSYMFSDCYSLSALNISNWNTSKVTNMYGMFNKCKSLISLNISNWDISKVTSMSSMFNDNVNLNTIIMTDETYSKLSSQLPGTWLKTAEKTYTRQDIVNAKQLTISATSDNVNTHYINSIKYNDILTDNDHTLYSGGYIDTKLANFVGKTESDESNSSIYSYDEITKNDSTVGSELYNYLINTKAKENGIVFANPSDKTYSYTLFQVSKNSGFILKTYNGVNPKLNIKYYGNLSAETPYENEWLELAYSQNYYTKAETDNKYVIKEPDSPSLYQIIKGPLSIEYAVANTTFLNLVRFLHPKIEEGNYVDICVGKSSDVDECLYLYYKDPGVGGLGVSGTPCVIEFDKNSICFRKNTKILSKLELSAGLSAVSWFDILNPAMKTNDVNRILIGKASTDLNSAYFGYKEPGIGYLGLFKDAIIIEYTTDKITLHKPTKIDGDLEVNGTISSLNPQIHQYDKTAIDETVGNDLVNWLHDTIKKDTGIVFANPGNKTYSYVMFQTLVNSGFILKNDGNDKLYFKPYEAIANTTHYYSNWYQLSKITDHYTKTESDNKYALKTDINASISDNYNVPANMIMLQSNENKNILIPCSETEYVNISSLSDSLEHLFKVDKVYGYESDVVGKLKIKQCRKVAIITSVNVNKFTHKHIEYNPTSNSLTILKYNDSHYPTGIQNLIFNNSLVTFNTIDFATDITNCIFDTSFEFQMTDVCKLHVNTSNVSNLSCMGIDVSAMTDMSKMFNGCISLTSLDLSNWNTSNVTNMSRMFDCCNSLTSLNISNWNVGNVRDMNNLFSCCISLTTLNISYWNTSNVEITASMFNGCISLLTLDISFWNTSNLMNTSAMFTGCSSLTSLNVSLWNTIELINIAYMFEKCTSLTKLDLSHWDISSWDISSVSSSDNIFDNCDSLTTILMTDDTYNKLKPCLSGDWIKSAKNTYTKINSNYVAKPIWQDAEFSDPAYNGVHYYEVKCKFGDYVRFYCACETINTGMFTYENYIGSTTDTEYTITVSENPLKQIHCVKVNDNYIKFENIVKLFNFEVIINYEPDQYVSTYQLHNQLLSNYVTHVDNRFTKHQLYKYGWEFYASETDITNVNNIDNYSFQITSNGSITWIDEWHAQYNYFIIYVTEKSNSNNNYNIVVDILQGIAVANCKGVYYNIMNKVTFGYDPEVVTDILSFPSETVNYFKATMSFPEISINILQENIRYEIYRSRIHFYSKLLRNIFGRLTCIKYQTRYYTATECDNKFMSKNTTITHYCPIDNSLTINDFQPGKPVFATGKVYRQDGKEWFEATANDTQDCICSVKSTGTWKEYVGIVVGIDDENNCLTFASHGDYLFTVNDSSKYTIGDIILYDGSIVDEDSPTTVKISQSIIGKVTNIVDNNTIAVFKD